MGETNPNHFFIKGTPPRWAGEFIGRESVLPIPCRLDPAQFPAVDAVKVVVSGTAAADAQSVSVNALSGPIPAGTVIDMGGKKFARLTAAAAKNAVSLAVSNLPTALAANDTGLYLGVGKKSVPSGTPIGRTYAERDAGAMWGPGDVNDDEFYLTVRDAADLSKDNEMELYRPKMTVKENFLPGWAGFASNIKAKIRAIYTCIAGV